MNEHEGPTQRPAAEAPVGAAAAQAPDVVAWLTRLQAREPQTIGRLAFTPLTLVGGDGGTGIALAHEAIAAGTLEIAEKDEGVVQELVATNKGPTPVAILEGDTLIGCKQNRVVAHSVLVAAGATAVVPVGCMQQGRWSMQGRRFSSGEMRLDPGFRRQAVQEATTAKRLRGQPMLVQRRLWDKVESRMAAYDVASPSADYHEALFQRRYEAREELARYQRQPGDVGVLVTLDGRLVALEVTGDPQLWAGLADRTLPSYAFLAADPEEVRLLEKQPADTAAGWLERLKRAEVKTSQAVGLGEDLEIAGEGLAGAGVQLSRQPVHVAVFGGEFGEVAQP